MRDRHLKSDARVAVFYRDFKDYACDYNDGGKGPYDGGSGGYGGKGYKQHRGLYINALMTARVLRKHGIQCDLAPVGQVSDVVAYLKDHCPTHAVFQAIWVPAKDMGELCVAHPRVHFVVRAHSQVGFLQVEPRAVKILRELLYLEQQVLNLTFSANSSRLTEFLVDTYKSPVEYLPNLYDFDRVSRKRDESHDHRVLRVGCFGAHRLLKNHTTAAAAALMMAERRSSDLEFYVNSGRQENVARNAIIDSLRAMFSNLLWAKLVEVPWQEWSSFRQVVAHMDLCMQPSFTETFNIVTCDAVCEGVPSVVGPAIEWVPERWKANTDDAADIARVGSHLLWDVRGAAEGLKALETFQASAVKRWVAYLDSNPTL